MLVVDDQVAGLEGERVDLVAALGVAGLGARRGTESVAGEVGFGDDDEVAGRPVGAPGEREPGVQDRLVDRHESVGGLGSRLRGGGGDLGLGQAFQDAGHGAVAGDHHRGPAAGADERAQPHEHGLHLGVLAARGGRIAGLDGHHEAVLGVGEETGRD